MKRSIIVILLMMLFLSSCNRKKIDPITCAKERGFFNYQGVIPISLDSIDNIISLYKQTRKYLDTLKDCGLDFGIVYNYCDSMFITNPDSNKNILIPAFHITSAHCQEERASPSFKIYINRPDSFLVINKINGTEVIFTKDFMQLRKVIDTFYYDIFLKDSTIRNYTYVEVIISKSDSFNRDFLKVFRILFNSYKVNMLKYFRKQKIDLCQDFLKSNPTDNYQFRVLIDDFDFRNIIINFIPPNQN